MGKALILLGLSILLSSCLSQLICPAYQSAYIYDKEELRKKFSYFNEDSTPKVLTASKTKYLVAVPESYRQKYKNLQTVEMKPIYPQLPDSLEEDYNPDFMLAERSFTDSTGVTEVGLQPGDSAYAITKKKEKYNVDQDIYMWYFRDVLVLPDVRAALAQNESQRGQIASEEKQGFFKRLFGRKNAAEGAETAVESDADEQPGFFGRLFGRNRTENEEGTPPVETEESSNPQADEPISEPVEEEDPLPPGEGF